MSDLMESKVNESNNKQIESTADEKVEFELVPGSNSIDTDVKNSNEAINGSVDEDKNSVEVQSDNNPVNSENGGDQNQSEPDQPLSLKERIKLTLLRKKTEDQNQDSTVEQSSSSGSIHVRIDNFQRPLNTKGLLQWLSETLGHILPESSIWINNIKTHCYLDFSTVEQAHDCIKKVTGLKYPSISKIPLEVNFTTVCVKDAPLSLEASLKPGEWLKSQTSKAEAANDASSEKPSALGKRKLKMDSSTPISLFKRATMGALQDVLPKSPGFPKQTITFDIDSKVKLAIEYSSEKIDQELLSLDVLFRKTKTLPPIYWLPVDANTAEERRKNRS